MKSLSRVRLFVTPWTVAHQAPLFMGFSRQEYWSGLPFPSPGDFPNPGIEPGSPTLQADALASEPPGNSVLIANGISPQLLPVYPWTTEKTNWKQANKKTGREEQDGGGVGGCGVHLSPRIHQEHSFRHKSACRTPAESRQEYLASRTWHKTWRTKELWGKTGVLVGLDLTLVGGGTESGIQIPSWGQLSESEFSSVQFSHSVVFLCDPMNCSTPGLPAHHHLLEFNSNSHPSSWWCHPAISSSVVPFSSCL